MYFTVYRSQQGGTPVRVATCQSPESAAKAMVAVAEAMDLDINLFWIEEEA